MKGKSVEELRRMNQASGYVGKMGGNSETPLYMADLRSLAGEFSLPQPQ